MYIQKEYVPDANAVVTPHAGMNELESEARDVLCNRNTLTISLRGYEREWIVLLIFLYVSGQKNIFLIATV